MDIALLRQRMGLKDKGGWSKDRPLSRSKPKPPKKEPVTYEDRVRQKMLDAIEYDRRRWERYQGIRLHRMTKLCESERNAGKWLVSLHSLEPTLTYIGWRDVDLDLADIAQQLSLYRLSLYDRYMLYEDAVSMVERVAKKQGHDMYRECPILFEIEDLPPNALDLLKAELRLY